MKSIKQFLSRPFLMWEYTTKNKLLTMFFTEVYFAAFIYIYLPFNFNYLTEQQVLFFVIMHGLVNIVILGFFYFVAPLTFNGYFHEKNRTIFREALWVVLLFFSASESHRYVGNIINVYPEGTMLTSLGITLAIGIFPFFILLLLAINRMVKEKNTDNELDPSSQLIEMSPNNGNDRIKLYLRDILYIKALDNYSEVYYTDYDNNIRKKLLRIPLSTLISTQLNSDYFVQSHRSYVVNLYNIKTFKKGTYSSKIYQKGNDTSSSGFQKQEK